MKLVFFGSPEVAVPALVALADADHQVAAVYTQPDRPAGRDRTPRPTPVKSAAESLGLEVRTPVSWRDGRAADELASWQADAFAVVAYGRILPARALKLPKRGVLNVHPSLLPRFRGTSPVQTAILEGERKTGVTVMLLDEGMDTGPILRRSDPEVVRCDDTCGSLTRRLFEAGAGLLVRTLEDWAAGTIEPEPQEEARATTTRILKRADGVLDWVESAEYLQRRVRAYDPWPGTHTSWRGRNLKVLAATDEPGSGGEPGTVTASAGRLAVATGAGALALGRLQLEGRRATTGEEFLRGHPDFVGALLPS